MKNYKIMRITGVYYSELLKSWVSKNSHLENHNYNDYFNFFVNDKNIFSYGFTKSFKKLKQEAVELIIDFEFLQKKWAIENNVSFSDENWILEIMMAQVKEIMPDIIFIQSHDFTIPGRFIKDRPNENLIKILKENCPFIKRIILFAGYSSSLDRVYHADHLFCSSPGVVEKYKIAGLDQSIKSSTLYHSFDYSIKNDIKETNKIYDFTFLGSSRIPESRYYFLKELFDKTDLIGWINENTVGNSKKTINQFLRENIKLILSFFSDNQLNTLGRKKYLSRKIINVIEDIKQQRFAFKNIKINKNSIDFIKNLYPKRCKEPVMGIEMYKILSKSHVTFNRHADDSFGFVGNMRLFESTGVGTCLLTDSGKNISELFEENKEVVTYKSLSEAVDKARYLIENKSESDKIAKAGQLKTLNCHTIMNRCQQIDEVIQQIL
tara:strand:- start:14898 stop:16205 length:1308 start_codon:yes stop_codon:yes gene_type:complete